MGLTEQTTDLSKQLRADLPEVVDRLNSKRSLIGRVIGERYELNEREKLPHVEFNILVSSGRNRAKNRRFVATIKVEDEGLGGVIYNDKGNAVIRDYIHGLAHQHNVPVGYLLFTDTSLLRHIDY